jgi:glycosyltransferase involved in cell wall biosynthesis
VQIRLLDRLSPQWIVKLIYRSAFSRDYLLEKELKKHNIAILSHYYGYLGKKSKIPTIGWIPDFQHRHLSEYFSKKEIFLRDRVFRNMCRFNSCILLSSYSAQKDLSDFAPSCVSKSRVLNFVKVFSEKGDAPALDELEKQYGFQGNFFLVCNQFWKHKNYQVIIEALHMLKGANHKVLVLATGNTQDYRHPGYFDELMNLAQKFEVLDSFRVLGVIPYENLVGLMKNAVSLINPSLFEGWSTIVEEAKSLGKRIILSDIPVHREQKPAGGIFFNPNDARVLADTMWNVWSHRDVELNKKLIENARKELSSRTYDFIRAYEDIILETLKKDQPA